jgi:murein DD-endopeptidase MepM/ murein hydrolase activator NlpD
MGTKLSRALLSIGLAAAIAAAAALPAYAVPATDFQMPFPCGQSWTGTTRANHSPSSNAIDWNRPDDLGDQVVAAAPGVVTRAEPRGTSGYGHYVRIEHMNGENTIYAHLTTVAVAVGQTVDQGGLLGTVGETGNATGPHLHFEERNTVGVVAPYFDGVRFVFGSTLASANCVDMPVAGNFLGGPVAEVAVFRRGTTGSFLVNRPTARRRC